MATEYLTNDPSKSLDQTIRELNPDKVLIITDSNVARLVLPKLHDSEIVRNSTTMELLPGEAQKNIKTVTQVWDKLEELGATRRSVVINIGGGIVTDLGGFAAATFKRGIRTVNFPTTLLGAVDAAFGGKTGINYMGLKNEIGAFHIPSKVILSTLPLSSLPVEELYSGYAELVKTALISDRLFYIRLLEMDKVLNDYSLLGSAIEKSVIFKEEITGADPLETGLRKVLNFGHTAGHAFESLRFRQGQPVTHGKAVAHGILVALILSNMILGFSAVELHHYKSFLKSNYGGSLIACADVKDVITIIASDKKNNHHGEPLFTLLKEIGEPEINREVSLGQLTEALEIYLDLMG